MSSLNNSSILIQQLFKLRYLKSSMASIALKMYSSSIKSFFCICLSSFLNCYQIGQRKFNWIPISKATEETFQWKSNQLKSFMRNHKRHRNRSEYVSTFENDLNGESKIASDFEKIFHSGSAVFNFVAQWITADNERNN